jgi:hypothetical protein
LPGFGCDHAACGMAAALAINDINVRRSSMISLPLLMLFEFKAGGAESAIK